MLLTDWLCLLNGHNLFTDKDIDDSEKLYVTCSTTNFLIGTVAVGIQI